MYEDIADEDLALYEEDVALAEDQGRWPHYAEVDEEIWDDDYFYTDYEEDDGWL